MGYGMKRGAAPKFRDLGSSPAKDTEGSHEDHHKPKSSPGWPAIPKEEESPADYKESPAKHGDHGGFATNFSKEKYHEDFHKEHGFTKVKKDDKGTTTTHKDYIPEERDFSEHNIAARETEGTIEEQEERRKNPPSKYKSPAKQTTDTTDTTSTKRARQIKIDEVDAKMEALEEDRFQEKITQEEYDKAMEPLRIQEEENKKPLK